MVKPYTAVLTAYAGEFNKVMAINNAIAPFWIPTSIPKLLGNAFFSGS